MKALFWGRDFSGSYAGAMTNTALSPPLLTVASGNTQPSAELQAIWPLPSALWSFTTLGSHILRDADAPYEGSSLWQE